MVGFGFWFGCLFIYARKSVGWNACNIRSSDVSEKLAGYMIRLGDLISQHFDLIKLFSFVITLLINHFIPSKNYD